MTEWLVAEVGSQSLPFVLSKGSPPLFGRPTKSGVTTREPLAQIAIVS